MSRELEATAGDAAAEIPLPAVEGRTRSARLLDRILDAGILLSLIGLVVAFSVIAPAFHTLDNAINILDASAIVGVVAVGMTIALIAGQFDLSVGSIVGFSSSVLALGIASWGLPVGLALLVAIAAAIGLGVVNGFLVVTMGINSIIATLGTLAAVRGVAFVLTEGRPVVTNNALLNDIGVSRPLGIPVSVYVMAGFYLVAYVMLVHGRLGIHVYAAGGNPAAAERAGVRVAWIVRLVFCITAFSAAVGGILITAKTFSGQAVYGQDLELDVLTAVLLGGVGLRGGEGSIAKTLVGVAIVGVITNGLVLSQVQGFYIDVARGVALVLAVVIEAWREKRARR